MPFHRPRDVKGYHETLRWEIKGLRRRAQRLRMSASHHMASQEELRAVRYFLASVLCEMADLAEQRLFDAEVNGGPIPEPAWDAAGEPVTKKGRRR